MLIGSCTRDLHLWRLAGGVWRHWRQVLEGLVLLRSPWLTLVGVLRKNRRTVLLLLVF